MHVLNVVDVNEALPRALSYLHAAGRTEPTRNGPAIVAPGPVATVYRYPRRRVLFDPVRDANPFFHLFESLWILEGRKDVAFLSLFNSRIAQYSDDGISYHAAYGYRLRSGPHGQRGLHAFDQIAACCDMLRADPYSRRAVMQIWAATLDLGMKSRDLPCNDMIMLRVREGETLHPSGRVLDITVCNRSNDAIWGAYGANAVQFSVLQEYMAAHIGVGIGEYTQMSHNLHTYEDNPYWKHYQTQTGGGIIVRQPEYDMLIMESPHGKSFYAVETPLVGPNETAEEFDNDLQLFFGYVDAYLRSSLVTGRSAAGLLGYMRANYDHHGEFATTFFENTVLPMLGLYAEREGPCFDSDWLVAGNQWVARRATSKTMAPVKEQS